MTFITITHPSIDDANQMWKLANETSLDANSSYSYLMMAKFFRDRCFVAKDSAREDSNRVIAFLTGFILKDNIYFIWQICVDPEYRGKGISKQLLSQAVHIMTSNNDVKFVQATINPDNEASNGLFASLADDNETFFSVMRGFETYDFPDDKPQEKLIQVGPL